LPIEPFLVGRVPQGIWSYRGRVYVVTWGQDSIEQAVQNAIIDHNQSGQKSDDFGSLGMLRPRLSAVSD